MSGTGGKGLVREHRNNGAAAFGANTAGVSIRLSAVSFSRKAKERAEARSDVFCVASDQNEKLRPKSARVVLGVVPVAKSNSCVRATPPTTDAPPPRS